MLKYRLLVAAVGLPVGLACIILGGYFILGPRRPPDHPRPARVLHAAPALPPQCPGGLRGRPGAIAGAYYWGPAGLLVGLAALVVLTFFWSLGGEIGAHLVGRMALTGFGVVWIAMGFAYVLLLRDLDHGMALTILLLACTIVNDTFAYFVGRALGSHKMAPRISPKKIGGGGHRRHHRLRRSRVGREDLFGLALLGDGGDLRSGPRFRGAVGRSVRIGGQAGLPGEGFGQDPARPRRHPRPLRRGVVHRFRHLLDGHRAARRYRET
jgi:hypothetical protein